MAKDFFQELRSQTEKIMSNFASTMDEFSSLASKSADNVGSLFILRGKIENLKVELNNLYKDVGKAVIESPDKDVNELVKEAREKQQMIEKMEAKINELKTDLKDSTEQTKKKTLQQVENTIMGFGSDLKKDELLAKEDIKDDIEAKEKEVDNDINKELDKEVDKSESDS